VNGVYIELALGPLRQMRRSLLGWGIGLGALVAVTVAFWPAFRGSSGISEAIDKLPSGVIDAFGLAGFGTPAGFLRGNLYEFIVPLLLAIAAVAAANGCTAAEEDAGRLETYLSQPVSRRSVFIGRTVALTVWLVILTSSVLVVQLVSDAVVGLEIDAMRVGSTVVLCGLLALLFGALALAIAGWLPRPSVVLAVGVAAAVGGYLIAALFPLSDVLKPASNLSPWKWALGGDPLVNAAEPWRSVALIVPVLVLVALAVVGFNRRDIRAA
jgi:ABC-2 type transport system permease protein